MDEQDIEHLKTVLRHIAHVRDACILLGERMDARKDPKDDGLGIRLIANGHIHDNSKFSGIEWHHLRDTTKESNPELFQQALQHHNTTNKHHPECWLDIRRMPRLYVAEMVCDWYARSTEFGTDLREWIKAKACKKYNMKTQDPVYREIMQFVRLLLDPPFK